MAVLNVATTINPRFDHVTPIESTRSDVTITHRCVALAELLAVARSGLVDIVLIADEFDLVSLDMVQQIRLHDGHGPKIAAISDIHDDRQRLSALGIPAVSPQLSPAELVDWLQDVYDQTEPPVTSQPDIDFMVELTPEEPTDAPPGAAPERPSRSGRRAAPYDPATDVPEADQKLAYDVAGKTAPGMQHDAEHSAADATGEGTPVERTGNLTALWGPLGSPGVTTLAVNLAVEVALTGRRVLLIDANTYGASIAVHLGLLDDSAAIAQACRTAEHRGLDVAGLTGHTQHVTVQGRGIDVLTGLTRAERWPQLRAAAFQQVLEVARQGWDEIVIDCGFGLEEDEELSFDIPAPQRNATTILTVQAANTVVAVGAGDPVGLIRFMRGLERLTEITSASVIPVMNKVTAMTSGLAPKRQLRGVWDRFGPGIPLQQFIEWAPEVSASALFNGKTLAEHAPKAEIRLAIQRLAKACIAPRDRRPG